MVTSFKLYSRQQGDGTNTDNNRQQQRQTLIMKDITEDRPTSDICLSMII